MTIENMTIAGLHAAYRAGELTPTSLVEQILAKCESYSEHNIWITLLTQSDIQPYLDRLSQSTIDDLPLYGIPFAIKDNIELAGFPTTAACEAFSYLPEQSAYVVNKLIEAGAIPIGKTNLDQFATGLVGVRSPEKWGVCKNSFDPEYLSGGSSSGSAVAVALGLVTFSLGTDTAGSGRVPAAFNNIVGLKPTKGLLSTKGVVPACRSLDCVSIFSLTTEDANTVFQQAADYDAEDEFARPNIDTNLNSYGQLTNPSFDFAVPQPDQLDFFGNDDYAALFKLTVKQFEALGGRCHEIDFEPFLTAARLLYEGPWVAERRVATQGVDRADMLPVIQTILAAQETAMAEDLFKAQYKLQACRQKVRKDIEKYDFILTPTAGTHYKIDQVLADPVQLNSNLGYYTNFMNLLDFSAVAIPAGFTQQAMPFGVTLFSRAFSDGRLMSYANLLHQSLGLTLGKTQLTLPEQTAVAGVSDRTILAVCGAHLEGQPLNWQLTQRGGKLVRKTTTSGHYKLYALAGGPPYRPALQRVSTNEGAEIEIELWSLPTSTLGSFLTGIPKPLGLGQLETQSGEWVTGFICEDYAIESAKEITRLKAWRTYLSESAL